MAPTLSPLATADIGSVRLVAIAVGLLAVLLIVLVLVLAALIAIRRRLRRRRERSGPEPGSGLDPWREAGRRARAFPRRDRGA